MGVEIEFRGEGAAEHGVVKSSTKPGAKIQVGDTIVRIHPQYYRPAEVDTLLGDASFAKKHLGWTPKTSFDALVREMAAADFALAAREAEGLIGARHGRHLVETLPG
jgi:GDPmannose 4,6-dehydratase